MIRLRPLLTENITHDTFMSVDIQPEYINGFKYFLPKFIQYMNENAGEMNRIVFLYNGYETMGQTDEGNYRMWLMENGLKEEVLDRIMFYDKGFAFFRYGIDKGLDFFTTSNFVRFMYENRISDSIEMTREMWAKYLRQYRREDKKTVFELLENNDDCIRIPDLMRFLERYNNILLVGGGVEECLAEVTIALTALRKNYDLLDKFTY